jgi:threonine dehydrogenase-like Zn-dependent dehydrogenase
MPTDNRDERAPCQIRAQLVGVWQLHPETVVTHRFRLDQADLAYQIADQGAVGKVCIVLD